jgi:hypothetical protein
MHARIDALKCTYKRLKIQIKFLGLYSRTPVNKGRGKRAGEERIKGMDWCGLSPLANATYPTQLAVGAYEFATCCSFLSIFSRVGDVQTFLLDNMGWDWNAVAVAMYLCRIRIQKDLKSVVCRRTQTSVDVDESLRQYEVISHH